MFNEEKIVSHNKAFEVIISNYGRGKQFEPKYVLHGKHSNSAINHDPCAFSIDNVKELRELNEMLSDLIKDAERRDKRHIPKMILKPSPKLLPDRFAEMEYDE